MSRISLSITTHVQRDRQWKSSDNNNNVGSYRYSRQRIFFSPFLFFFFSPFFFFCYKIAWDSKFRSFFFFFFNYLYFFLAKQDPKLFEFPKNSCKEFFLFFTIAFLDSRPLILSLSLSFAHSLSLSRSLSLLALLNKQYL